MSDDAPAAATPLWRSPRIALAVAAGAGVLNTLAAWRTLLFANDASLYYIGTNAWHDHLAALVLTLAIATVVFLIARGLARSASALAPWLFAAFCGLLILNGLDFARVALFSSNRDALVGIGAAGAIATLGIGGFAWRRGLSAEAFAGVCAVALAIFAPLAATTAAQGAFQSVMLAVEPAPEALQRESGATTGERAKTRVVWIIFDELDRRVLVDPKRPHPYPNFEALLAESLDVVEAIPPAAATALAMPSLWLERRVAGVNLAGATDLQLRFEEDGEAADFSSFENLFESVAKGGRSAGAMGFYHPYCRLFRESLDRCHQYHVNTVLYRETTSFIDSLGVTANSLLPNWRRRVILEVYERMRADSISLVADPSLDFVALHFNLPHSPYIYHRESGELRAFAGGLRYEDNIALADLTLGLLIDAMKQAGLWDHTALIVGADHGWRKKKGYDELPGAVPVIARFPGQPEALKLEGPTEAFHTRSLILSTLDGQLTNAPEAAALLRRLGAPQ